METQEMARIINEAQTPEDAAKALGINRSALSNLSFGLRGLGHDVKKFSTGRGRSRSIFAEAWNGACGDVVAVQESLGYKHTASVLQRYESEKARGVNLCDPVRTDRKKDVARIEVERIAAQVAERVARSVVAEMLGEVAR